MNAPERTLAAVWKAENSLRALRDHVNTYRLPALLACALVWVFALGALRSRHGTRIEWLFGWFQRYRTFSKRLLLITTALASFTIFSGVVPALHATVEARMRRLSEKYVEYARASEAVMRQSTSTEIVRRVLRESTAEWRAAVQLRAALEERLDQLDQRLRYVHTAFGAQPQPASSTAWQMPPAGEAGTASNQPKNDPTPRVPPDAGTWSESEINTRLSVLRRFGDRVTEQAAELFHTEIGSKLPGEVIGQILSANNWSAFAGIASEYPLVGALAAALEKTATEVLASRIRNAAARMRASSQAGMEAVIQEQATAAAASAAIDGSELTDATARMSEEIREEAKIADRLLAKCDSIEAAGIADLRARDPELIRSIQRVWELMTEEHRSVFRGSSGAFGAGAVDEALKKALLFDNQEDRERLVAEIANIIATEPTYDDRVTKLHQLTVPQALFDGRPALPARTGSAAPLVSAWNSLNLAAARLHDDRTTIAETKKRIAEDLRMLHEASRARLGGVPPGLAAAPPLRIGALEIPRIGFRLSALRMIR